jgi:hypothetical protein
MNEYMKNHWTKGPFADEIKKAISEKKKGLHVSPDTEFYKGQPNPFKGKKIPWAEKLIESRKNSKCGGWNKGKKGVSKGWPKGKVRSPELLARISACLKGRKVWNTGMGIGTPLGHSIRRCDKYVEWRTSVFKRDNFKCVQCKAEGRMHADHIKPFALVCKENKVKSLSDALKCKELWKVANGRTLCVKCHRKTSTYSGKVQSTLYKYPRLV